ncbi:MAG: NlpC/P60 family protein [Lawsonella clevelandensis]
MYAPNPIAAKAIESALSQIGVPDVWGGTSPGVGLDCSGLTQWAYEQAGLKLAAPPGTRTTTRTSPSAMLSPVTYSSGTATLLCSSETAS